MAHTFLFDLDGTLTSREILPEIAAGCGMGDEIAELTSKTIAGEIPFHQSFLTRVEMFRHVPISKVRDIVATVPLNEHIVEFIRDHVDSCWILTGNLDVWVKDLCASIGARAITSRARTEGDFVIGVDHVLDKGSFASGLECAGAGSRIVAVGDGNNDALMIERAAIGIAFGGVHAPAASVMSGATHAIYDGEALCRFLRQL